MKVYRQLVKVFMRSGEMDSPKQKKQKLFYAIMGVIAIVGIMIPCCLLIGYLSYAFSFTLQDKDGGLLFLVHFVSLLSVMFGIQVVLNVFYFSGDLDSVLPLPVSPGKIVAAKFTAIYISESMMQFGILLSAMIGCLIATKMNVFRILLCLIGVVTLPVVPLAYCGIICVLIMGLTKWIQKKEHVRRLSILFLVAVMVFVVAGIRLLKDMNLQSFVEDLGAGKVSFVTVCSYVFPTNALFTKALVTDQIGLGLGYVVANIVIVGVFLWLADKLYLRGVAGAGNASLVGHKKKVREEKRTSPKRAYIKKELRVLFRTPAFFLNCVAVNLLWPVLFYVIYLMQARANAFTQYLVMYHCGNESLRWAGVLIVILLSVLLTAANSIASSAITREGKQYYVMKYIPLKYSAQLAYKADISIAISFIFCAIYIIIASVILGVPNITSWYYLLLSFICVCFISYFGLYLDTVNPKLTWDDELNALRGNVNVFFNMAYAMAITAAFAVVLNIVYLYSHLPLYIMEIILLVVIFTAVLYMRHMVMTKGQKNLEMLI